MNCACYPFSDRKSYKTLMSFLKNHNLLTEQQCPIFCEMRELTNEEYLDAIAYTKSTLISNLTDEEMSKYILKTPPALNGICIVFNPDVCPFEEKYRGINILTFAPLPYLNVMNNIWYKIHFDKSFISIKGKTTTLFKAPDLIRPLYQHEIDYLERKIENPIKL